AAAARTPRAATPPRRRAASRTRGEGSFDHLVGECDQFVRNSEAERTRGLEVDYELEFGGLLHWEVSGLGALDEDLVNVASGTPKKVSETRPIGHEPAGCRKFSNSM